jgi:DNA uptake protein ComE-like DNA-binding protein
VRLAARLTGWNITIKSESQSEEEKSTADTSKVSSVEEEEGTPGILDGLSEKISAALVEAGLDNHQAIIAASDKDLLNIPGLGPKTVEKLRELTVALKEAGEE